VIAGIVRDSFDWFVDIVAERRDCRASEAIALADGRIYTGRQALAARLIDAIGGEDEAVAWLADAGRRRRTCRSGTGSRDATAGMFSYADAVALWIAQRVGLAPDLLPEAPRPILPESLKLDGLSVGLAGFGRQGLVTRRGAAK
jgi:protease IV